MEEGMDVADARDFSLFNCKDWYTLGKGSEHTDKGSEKHAAVSYLREICKTSFGTDSQTSAFFYQFLRGIWESQRDHHLQGWTSPPDGDIPIALSVDPNETEIGNMTEVFSWIVQQIGLSFYVHSQREYDIMLDENSPHYDPILRSLCNIDKRRQYHFHGKYESPSDCFGSTEADEAYSKRKKISDGHVTTISYKGVCALEVISNMYKGVSEQEIIGSEDPYDVFLRLKSTVKFLNDNNDRSNPHQRKLSVHPKAPRLKFIRNVVEGEKMEPVAPSKASETEVGFDLTLIGKVKDLPGENHARYDSGITVIPPYGWYCEVVPRSSFATSGYRLTNNVAIIDPTYTGTIQMCLQKVDPTSPDIQFPVKWFQIIMRPIVFFEAEEISMNMKPVTKRKDGGFGSTNNSSASQPSPCKKTRVEETKE